MSSYMLSLSIAAGMLAANAAGALDYGPYNEVLQTYVNERGMVDYKALKANPGQLNAFLDNAATLERSTYESWSDDAKIAFWINAYNAYTLKAIIEHYPIEAGLIGGLRFPDNSIRQIDGVWTGLEWEVMGEMLTLDAMEHEILRKEFKDEPRVHAALVCAAMSCPPLRREAFTGEQLDAQLDNQMREWMSHPDKFAIDRESNVVHLSKIFQWFGRDFLNGYATETEFQQFSSSQRAVLNAVAEALPDEQATYLREGDYTIEYLPYDWSLNEQS